MDRPSPATSPSRRARTGIATSVIVATVLGAGAVSAQSPSASPLPGASAPAPTSPQQPDSGKRPRLRVFVERHWGGRQEAAERRGPGDRQGVGERGFRRGFGRGDMPMVDGRRLTRRLGRPAITVTAITAPTVSLATDDGWLRDIDTTGVEITRNGQAITLGDISVGDAIRLAQTRNADGTWTVTRMDVQLAVTEGTVASVDATGFGVTQADGSVVTVGVSDTTRWVARRGSAGSLSDLVVGTPVIAKGIRGPDGSINAIAVGVGRTPSTAPVTPDVSPAPAATPG